MLDKVQLDTPGLRVKCCENGWTGTVVRMSEDEQFAKFFPLPMVRWDISPFGCVEHCQECLEELIDG